ncbi:MAG: hypothetical protein JWP97_1000 [Labilithrix sp.]|nr:hypothetical protein [Labilithrix sp.]
MSVDAGLTLELGGSFAEDPGLVLGLLLGAGWGPSGGAGLEVVRMSDDGEERVMVRPDALLQGSSQVAAWLANGGSVAVTLVWKDSGIGGELIFTSASRVVFSATINRLTLNPRTTDVSWYLTRLLPALVTSGGHSLVESWTWTETA